MSNFLILDRTTVLSTSFRKSFLCLALYTKEVKLQTFVITTYAQKVLF